MYQYVKTVKSFLKKYWYWIVATLFFVVAVLFFSNTKLPNYLKAKETVGRLHREIERYEAQIEEDSVFLENVKTDEYLEKYAREKHLMHSADEQLFIVE